MGKPINLNEVAPGRLKPRAAAGIPFRSLPWVRVEGGGASGRTRRHVLSDGGTARLLDIYPGWNEAGWCEKGHVGYVLSGTMRLDFASQPCITVRKGDGFEIPPGCAHKASTRRGAHLFIVG